MIETDTNSADNTDLIGDLKIIDTDTHLSEPLDLWTSRAPAAYKDLVPQVKELPGGRRRWVVNGDIAIAQDQASSVVGLDGEKILGAKFFDLTQDQVHAASYDMGARTKMMDDMGVHAQIMYPNVAGFGSQNFLKVDDVGLRQACVEIYNDVGAENQALSNERVFTMALMPWWDIDASVKEIERCAAMGMKGIVTCSNPEESGMPDMNEDAWNPFWEACVEHKMPVNFHIGSSKGLLDFFGKAAWPSFGRESNLAIVSANLFMGNARVIGNLIYSGVPERYPDLKFVSVESGIGWIPFFLEALDHQLSETAPTDRQRLSMLPSEYFRRNFYGCFWFEKIALTHLVDVIGVENILFETDFPHPTCLYPKSSVRVNETLSQLTDHQRRRILQDNAAELYNIPV